jgi:geranylgeranyl diphosphate synthase type I
MQLKEYISQMRPAVEAELRLVFSASLREEQTGLVDMLSYHMGWSGNGAGPDAQGKRIRPLLVLLSCAAANGDWHKALPAAAAVELIHNFSLIHDDIQDQSELRRGRATIWKLWGMPQAINAGDLMFTLSYSAVSRLADTANADIAVKATMLINQACIRLTRGQFLDISYESRRDLVLEDYWPMVSGKTAALLACSAQLGALTSGANASRQQSFFDFGHNLGLAFQAMDDELGIWGNTASTGKSVESDLLAGKKTLPVLYALEKKGQFARRWARGPVQENEVPELAALLEEEGAREYTQQTADALTKMALDALDQASQVGDASIALRDLAMSLLSRKK